MMTVINVQHTNKQYGVVGSAVPRIFKVMAACIHVFLILMSHHNLKHSILCSKLGLIVCLEVVSTIQHRPGYNYNS